MGRNMSYQSQRALICFSIGKHYKDQVWCDVVRMDACHLLLGRPWQYDLKVKHDGFKNTHSFVFDSMNITLVPSRPSEKNRPPNGSNLLSFSKFEHEMENTDMVYLLLNKEVTARIVVPQITVPLIEEFSENFPNDLPEGLPPVRDIQHHIDLEPGAM